MGHKIQTVLYSPSHVPYHCAASIWRKRISDFCNTALVNWPGLYLLLSLNAKGVPSSNSHKATPPAYSTLLTTISLDLLSRYFYSPTQEVPCGSGDMNEGLLYRAENIHLKLNLLARKS